MTYDITHESSAQRFTTVVDGVFCVLEYRLQDGVMTIAHTGVPDAVGGRGIAAALATKAFDTARAEGWKVVPACAYAAVFVQKHPEYADLIL